MTTLTFGQKLPNPADAAQMGPGWTTTSTASWPPTRDAAARVGALLSALAEHYEELHVPAGAKHEPRRRRPAADVRRASARHPRPRLAP